MTIALAVGAASVIAPTAAHADVAGRGGDYISLSTEGHLLDTRSGLGAAKATLGTGGIATFQVLGVGGVPTSNVTGIMVDVTVVSPSAAGSLQLAPDSTTVWPISDLNFPASSAPYSDSAVVGVGTDGKVQVRNQTGTVNVVIDVQGYYTATTANGTGPGGLVPINHTRILDTRSGLGGVPVASIAAGKSLTVNLAKTGAIPTSATSVNLGFIVLGTAAGWLGEYPLGGNATAATSVFDFPIGTNTSGGTAKLGTSSSVVFVNHSSAAINLVLTAEGYTTGSSTTGAGYRPARFRAVSGVTVAANATVDVQVAGRDGVPTRGVAAIAANLTETSSTAAGHLSAWPTDGTDPALSLANWASGVARGELAILKVGADGKIRVRNVSTAAIHVYVDVEAWYYDGVSTAVDIAQNAATIIDQPTVAGAVEGAYVRNGGGLYHGYAPNVDDLTTAQWTPVASNLEAFTGQPSLIRVPSGKLLVAVLHARDGEVWTFETASGASWPTPTYVHTGGIMAAPPVSGAMPDGSVLTFGVDADGALWMLPEAGTAPVWQSLGNAHLVGSPTVVTLSDGLQLIARTTSGTVTTATYRNGALGAWTDLGGVNVVGKPAAVVNDGPRVRIVAAQADGTVITKLQSIGGVFPSNWTTVGTQGATFVGSPAIGLDKGSGTDPGSGKAFIVMRNSVDNYLYEADELGEATGTWGEWNLIPGQANPAATDATVTPFTGNANNLHWIASYLDINGTPRFVHAATQ